VNKIPIGKSDFKTLRDEQMFFVDKSLLIKEFIDTDADIILLSRPGIFGKTFNLSMLRYFFEMRINPDGSPDESLNYLFTDLLIWKEASDYLNLQGDFPVIWLTFKDISYNTFVDSLRKISKIIQYEFNRHRYLLNGNISETEKNQFNEILNGTNDPQLLEIAIRLLIELLERNFKRKVMVFIDDIDTPIYTGFVFNYHDKIRAFIQNFLGNSFKDNPNIYKVLMTCTLNVFRENSFSSFLNFNAYSLTDPDFNTFFGYTETEMTGILNQYMLQEKSAELKKWYSGINFGGNTVYNIWSMNNYMASIQTEPCAFWSIDIYDELLKHLIITSSILVKQGVFDILSGGSTEQSVSADFSLPDLGKTDESFWSFMVHYGYLRATFVKQDHNKSIFKIEFPNIEVENLFVGTIKKWLDETVGEDRILFMIKAIKSCGVIERTPSYFEVGKTPDTLDSVEQLFYEFINAISTFYKFKDSETGNIVQVLYIAILLYIKNTNRVLRAHKTDYGDSIIYIVPKYWNGVKDDVPEGELAALNQSVIDYMEGKKHGPKAYIIGCRLPVYRNETLNNACTLIHHRLNESPYIDPITKLNISNIVNIAAGVSRYRIDVFGSNYGKSIMQQLFSHTDEKGNISKRSRH